MRGDYRAAFALATALGALVEDWIFSEMFLTRAMLWYVVSALALNALLLAVIVKTIKKMSDERTTTRVLRIAAIFIFIALLMISLRSATHPTVALGFLARFTLIALVAMGAFALVRRLNDALSNRLMTAVGLASLAFLLVPVVAKMLSPAPRDWILAAPAPATAGEAAPRRATLFLLLDELGYTAAQPLANDLRHAGLTVQYDALIPAGKDTQNVIPSMFSGFDFSNVRVCGLSAMCSDLNTLAFSSLRVRRPDVHVIGQHFPYCDIQGLKSCFQVQSPYTFGSVYRSLIAFCLKRLGMPIPASFSSAKEPADHQRQLLQKQTSFIDKSAFWQDGGVMYVHLFMPHPPGLDGLTTLDADYAANIEVSRKLVASYVNRLQIGFGEHYSLILTADHPLRKYWCDSEWYGSDRCATRLEFQDDKVPIIVASPETVQRSTITQNRDVFQVLNQLAAR